VKFLILLVVLILVAPNIAKHFSRESSEPSGLMYRLGRKFGFGAVATALILGLVAACVLLVVAARGG
jgi:hypothetical protein